MLFHLFVANFVSLRPDLLRTCFQRIFLRLFAAVSQGMYFQFTKIISLRMSFVFFVVFSFNLSLRSFTAVFMSFSFFFFFFFFFFFVRPFLGLFTFILFRMFIGTLPIFSEKALHLNVSLYLSYVFEIDFTHYVSDVSKSLD